MNQQNNITKVVFENKLLQQLVLNLTSPFTKTTQNSHKRVRKRHIFSA